MKCEVKHNWDMRMGIYGWVGHLWLNGWGIYSLNGLGSHGKLLFRSEICSKNAGFQGSTLSGHRMTIGSVPLNSCLHYSSCKWRTFCMVNGLEWILHTV